jgi:hypothetical protein
MKFPWISRFAHEAVTTLLRAEAAELKEERKLLLDRLATLGFGGPLSAKTERNVEETPEEEPDLAHDPEQELLESMMRLRRRPTKLADSLTRRIQRESRRSSTLTKVAWIPQALEIGSAEEKKAPADPSPRHAGAQDDRLPRVLIPLEIDRQLAEAEENGRKQAAS